MAQHMELTGRTMRITIPNTVATENQKRVRLVHNIRTPPPNPDHSRITAVAEMEARVKTRSRSAQLQHSGTNLPTNPINPWIGIKCYNRASTEDPDVAYH